jgi:DNA-binding NarL/FixJ family response regulator
MQLIRTLVVDDHPLFAETLAARLAREPDFEVLPIAQDERRARTLLSTLSPSVVVLDLLLGAENSLPLLDEIQVKHPGARVVMLTGVSAVDKVIDGVRRGAKAWLPKTSDSEHVVRVIRGVHRGHSWLPPELLGEVLRQLTAAVPVVDPGPLALLTARERQVLQCAVDGLSKPDIARSLHMSPNTVRTHTQNMLAKLAAHSTLEAVSLARRHGMRPTAA